jgi:hypothetical protein
VLCWAVSKFSFTFFSLSNHREGPTRPPKRPPARRWTNVGQWYKTHRAPITCVCIHVSSPGTGSPLLPLSDWSASSLNTRTHPPNFVELFWQRSAEFYHILLFGLSRLNSAAVPH